jgi:hypothetical protein
MVARRRRFKQTTSLEERLSREVQALRQQAGLVPEGFARDALLRRASENEATLHLTRWLNSPGLRPPE